MTIQEDRIKYLETQLTRKLQNLSAMIECYKVIKDKKDKLEDECRFMKAEIDAIKEGQMSFEDLDF